MNKRISFMLIFISIFVLLLISCGKSKNDNDTTSNTGKVANQYYNISFVNYDNTILQRESIKKGQMPLYKGDTPIKESTNVYQYNFIGWDSELSVVNSDKIYKAIFEEVKRKYYIFFENSDGSTLSSNQYEYGTSKDDIEIPNDPIKDSNQQYTYEFIGWYPEIEDVTRNQTYTPIYNQITNKYSVTFVDEDGETILKESTLYEYGTSKDDIEIPNDPIKESTKQYTYTFNGWDKDIEDVTENVTYKATYTQTLNKYSVTFVDEDGETILKESTLYDYGTSKDCILLPDTPTKQSTAEYTYTFAGWDKELSDVTEDVVYVATYNETPNSYNLTINNKISDRQYILTGGSDVNEYGTLLLLIVNTLDDEIVLWLRSDDEESSFGDTYMFNMPSHDLTITVSLLYEKEDNVVYFGSYPQSLVTDSEEKEKLYKFELEEPTKETGWTAYQYYINSEIVEFMYYLDVDLDNDGAYDYRGVYFTEYRPYYFSRATSGSSDSYQSRHGYDTTIIYWFRYEPIKWYICKQTDGKAFLISDLALDSQEFMPSDRTDQFEHNGGTGYANDYKLSSIRKWLNDNFYNTAFNSGEKEAIQSTVIDNDQDMKDKIFIVSDTEMNIVPSDNYQYGTDYAKCQGLDSFLSVQNSAAYKTVDCWTRTAYFSGKSGNFAWQVSYNGEVNSGTLVRTTTLGVRPCLWLDLM